MGLDLKIEQREPGSVEPPKKVGLRERIKAFFANPKKRLIFIIVAGLVLIALVGIGLYFLTYEARQKKADEKKEAEKPTLYQAPLDGVMTDLDASKRHPLGIMVENHTGARPQIGLNKSSVIYEAIAEGGITRYMAVFGTSETDVVGPVRSARTYYVDWAEGYNAYYAHVGGNIDALDKISSDKVLDLDQFKFPSAYWRDSSRRVSSEHTMFTSTSKLRAIASEQNYTTANNFSVYKYKDDPTAESDEGKALSLSQVIKVNFSSANYDVQFDYDRTTNSYLRSLAGKPDKDGSTGEQLSAKVVAVMTVKRSPTTTRINESGYNMVTVGEGAAKIYLDGKEIVGTWKKSSTSDREIFYDSTGKEITFNRGKLWICVIPPEGSVNNEIVPAAAKEATSN